MLSFFGRPFALQLAAPLFAALAVAALGASGGCGLSTSPVGTGASGPGSGGGATTTHGAGGHASTSSGHATGSSSAATGGASAGGGGTGGAGAGSVCGNGIPEAGEGCDDGNTTPGDRCSASCMVEDPDHCPGTSIPLSPGTFLITDTTAGADDTFTKEPTDVGNCMAGTYPGPDLVYAVTPTVSGTLSASLTANYGHHSVHAKTTCGDADDIACMYGYQAGEVDSISFGVTAGATYYVIVDAWMGESGAFQLTLTL